MKHLKLTIAEIMQPNILFYDKIAEPACFDICNYLKINNMPSITGTDYFELIDNKFHKTPINSKHQVLASSKIFTNDIIKQFAQNNHNVLFVYEENALVGVVHIADYNRDIVLQCIQDDMLILERKLRQLILLNGYTNEDMKLHFEKTLAKTESENTRKYYENKINSYNKNKVEINSLGQFQLFEFTDLMNFAHRYEKNPSHQFIDYEISGKKISSIEILRSLRNMAMHSKNPIGRNADTLIYSLKSLEIILSSLQTLRSEYSKIISKIRSHPDLIRSIELDNRSKLEIIHNHHPKALDYFIGN